MYKFLTKAIVFAPLLPPVGDLPKDMPDNTSIESFSWKNDQFEVEIKFIFPEPIKKTHTISEKELHNFFHYKTEILTTGNTIREGASKSIFSLEQALDAGSFFSQAACKILEFVSIVNLTQIEDIIKKKNGSFEKGTFRKQKISETKSFPLGRLIFLTEMGTKKIGRNLFWFRKGLTEFSVLHRFVAFFTALEELNSYFQGANRKDGNFPPSLKDFLELSLKISPDSFRKWKNIRNDIVHFTSRKKDYRKISREARVNLPDLYNACYYAIARFFTNKTPKPSPLIFYEDLEKEVVETNPEIVKQLTLIHARRNKGFKEIKIG